MTLISCWLSCLGPLVLLLPNYWLSNLPTLCVHEKVYSRNALCALSLISTLILYLYCHWWYSYQNVNSIGAVMVWKKRVDFHFPIVNIPFICSNILAAPAYGVYISQLTRYSRACGSFLDFLGRGLLLTSKLPNQMLLLVKFKSWHRKLYSCHQRLGWP
jgi:hypothetical protein